MKILGPGGWIQGASEVLDEKLANRQWVYRYPCVSEIRHKVNDVIIIEGLSDTRRTAQSFVGRLLEFQ